MDARSILVRLVLLAGMLPFAGACQGSTTPGGPTPSAPVGYEGEWRGTTFQNLPISFKVSADQRVTEVTVGYRLDTCTGSETSSDSLGSTALASPPGLIFSFRLSQGAQIQVQAFSMPDRSLWGTLLFVVPQACGLSEAIAGSVVVTRR